MRPVAKTVSYGIPFIRRGALNIAQNTLAAVIGVLLSVSGFVAWWKRRPKGELGVPTTPEMRIGIGMGLLIAALMLLLPLMGVSLIAALILDWLIFSRFGWITAKASQTI